MELTSMEWSVLTGLGVLVGRYFFDKWNRTSEEGENASVTMRECRHNRGNCANLNSLHIQHLTLKVDDLSSGIHAIKVILLQVATNQGVDSEKLGPLTK